MKLLITGSNGFIGSHLKKEFEKENDVFVVVRTVQGFEINNKVCQLDLSNDVSVKKHFQENIFGVDIDIIIHCAAILSSNDNKDMRIFYRNISITESLVHIAKVTKAKKLINISSIGVYPNCDGFYSEISIVEPSENHECLYGLAKFCSEELFKFHLKDTLKVINLRLAQVYGKGMREDRIFSIMKSQLLRENKITVYGNGERVSNFISIEYLIKKMNFLIHKDHLVGTYNIGEKNLSYLELAKMIILEYGNNSSLIEQIPEGLKSKVYIDTSKISNI